MGNDDDRVLGWIDGQRDAMCERTAAWSAIASGTRDLDGRSLHWEPDQYPDEAAWNEFEKMLKEHPAQWIIWEGPPVSTTISRLKEIGVDSVVFRPCGNVPASGDYLETARQNAKNLEKVFVESR